MLQFGHVAEGTRAKRQLPYIFFAEGVHLGEVEFRVLWVFEVGEVVAAQDHVLRRDGDRTAVGRRQDVVAGQHEDAGLGLRLRAQRQVDRHLVAVEVGVEGGAHQRMQLDGLALDELGLEGLNAQAVQGRGAVQQDRVLGDDLFEDVPDFRELTLHELLGGLDVLHLLTLHQAAHDEGLEQLQRHGLGDTALMQAELRAGHDDRTAGVVHACRAGSDGTGPVCP